MYCKKIAELLSEQQEHPLSLRRRMMIRFHLSMCVFCRRLASQLDFIRKLSKSLGSSEDGSLIDEGGAFDVSLPPDAKIRIKKILAHKNP